MTRGKTIQIYLPDGNPKGIKKCKIIESICRAILIPRNELKNAKEIAELNWPGVYFLISRVEESEEIKLYIGEGEEIFKRVSQHDVPEKEWVFAICFFSATNNINKAHIKFLESYCYKRLSDLGRLKLVNSNCPIKPKISEEEQNLLEGFFDEMRILLGALGYPIFEEIKKTENVAEIFYCKKKLALATGNLTEEGFVVYKNSKANVEDRPSSNKSISKKKKKLIVEGVLKVEGNVLIFTQDYVFNSPSIAAAVVIGGNANGWIEWKNNLGLTLDELKRKEK